MTRRTCKQLKIGQVAIGGDAPIGVQSMTKTDTRDIPATITQIKELQDETRVHLLASGPIMQQALEAQSRLEEMEIRADVWSVTSFNELYRDAIETERWNRLHPTEPQRTPYLGQVMAGKSGVFVAATDYIKALPYSIAPWIPGRYQVLGTDGYGMSESRPDLRNHFEIDARFITVAALQALAQEGAVTTGRVADAIQRFAIDPDKLSPSEV